MNLSNISDRTLLQSLYRVARHLSYLNAGEGPQYNPELIALEKERLGRLKAECESRKLEIHLSDYLI